MIFKSNNYKLIFLCTLSVGIVSDMMDKYLSLFAQLVSQMQDPGSDNAGDDHYDGFLINEANKQTSIWPLIPPECPCGIKIPTGATCASLLPKPGAASLS